MAERGIEMTKFEINKKYEWYQREYGSIQILKRTPKCVQVTNGASTWRMIVRTDDNGDEYVIDSSVPYKWRDAFTCSANWVED